MERRGLAPEAERRVRNAAILQAVLQGETCVTVGHRYGVTAAGVGSIVRAECFRRNAALAREAVWQYRSLDFLRAHAQEFGIAPLESSG